MSVPDVSKQDERSGAEWAARAGLSAKGAMYVLLGLVAGQLAFGVNDADASQQGAFSALARQPFGAVLLGLVALGLVGYALWRGRQAVVGVERESSLPEPLLRLTFAARAVAYSVLAILAVRELMGLSQGGEESATAALLATPGGVVLVVAVGVILVVVGLAQWREAIACDFLQELDVTAMTGLERRLVRVMGVAGHAARGTAFGLVGIFLVVAALSRQQDRVVGLDAVLQQLREVPFGVAGVVVVAAGLMVYGAFCFVQTHAAKVHSVD